MKKSLIAAALLIAFGTVTFAQDAAKPADKKTTTTKSDKKADKKADKKSDKKAGGEKKAAADKK